MKMNIIFKTGFAEFFLVEGFFESDGEYYFDNFVDKGESG